MVGKGALFFAVWGYVIAKQRPNRTYGSIVELNPKIIAFTLGENEEAVKLVIQQMCEKDLESRSQEEDGKKLIQLSQFSYQVVNGERYRLLRSAEERREYQRTWKRDKRQQQRGGSARERQFVKAVEAGDVATADRMSEPHLGNACTGAPGEAVS